MGKLVDALKLIKKRDKSKCIPCSERLPTEADADPFGKIIAYLPTRRDFSIQDWQHVKRNPVFYSHWMPTGLTRPAPPEQESDQSNADLGFGNDC